MKNLFLFLSLLVLVSCDPVKRHAKLVEKYPYVHKDVTQVIHDTTTIVVPEIKHDTTFIRTKQVDTFIIQKERLRVEIRKHYDTMYVDAECMSDTITIYKQLVVPMYASEVYAKRYGWIVWIFVFIFLIALILSFFKKLLL